MASTDEHPLGKRKSNKPKAFQPTYGSFSKSGTAAEIENPIGDGDAFESIPVIKQRVGALQADAAELKFLHSVIFGNQGDSKTRKSKLLKFKGLKGGSSASTDAMRVRAKKTLMEPSTKNMVPTLIHLLCLVEDETIGRSISQIMQFLGSPSLKKCADEEEESDDGKVGGEESRPKAPAPRKNAKKAREPASDADEEPVQKRQRGARTGKQKSAPKKSAETKAAKRKAAEVEIEVTPEPEEAAKEDIAPVEAPKAVEVDEQGDAEMQVSPDEPVQEEADNDVADNHENDPEPAPGPAMHPYVPPVIGGAPQHHGVPAASDHPDQDPGYDDMDSESEPPPPGLENVHEQVEHVKHVREREAPPQPEAPPIVPPSQRPPIGSQASPCDAAKPGSHGRSQPPQLGPHALQPPLERVGTSDGHAVVSHDNGSVTKAGRARGTSKKPAGRLPVAAQVGTSKKAAPNSRRGVQAVAAVNQVPTVVQQQLSGLKKQSKVQPSSDAKKLLLQAEKHQKALVALHETVQKAMEGHAAHLDGLKKFASATS